MDARPDCDGAEIARAARMWTARDPQLDDDLARTQRMFDMGVSPGSR
jgi:hypothetical protein